MGPGIVTTTGPIRIATWTATASIEKTSPRCNGSFSGSGKITAAYPPAGPGTGPPASYTITFALIDKTNVTVSFDPVPDLSNLKIDSPSDPSQAFSFSGSLIQSCDDGSFKVQATLVNVSKNPPSTTATSTPLVTVPAVDFAVIEGLGAPRVNPVDQVSFEVPFALHCCAKHAKFTIEFKDQENITDLACQEPDLKCEIGPASTENFVISGKRPNASRPGQFNVNIAKAGGRTCRLGTVVVGAA
jgi:hypothetical protein